MLRLRRPADCWLRELAERERDRGFTYDEVGATATGYLPDGYRHGRWTRPLGTGDEVFERAAAALQHWFPQRTSGFSIGVGGLVEPGVPVAIAAPLPIGFAVATARVVYVEAEADRYAWAYGTLPIHPIAGEERFAVLRRGADVIFEILSFSRDRHPLSRALPPLAHRLQGQATRRYLDAMAALTSPTG